MIKLYLKPCVAAYFFCGYLCAAHAQTTNACFSILRNSVNATTTTSLKSELATYRSRECDTKLSREAGNVTEAKEPNVANLMILLAAQSNYRLMVLKAYEQLQAENNRLSTNNNTKNIPNIGSSGGTINGDEINKFLKLNGNSSVSAWGKDSQFQSQIINNETIILQLKK